MVILSQSLKEFLKADFTSLSIGLTPSGKLHIGTLFTICLGFYYLKEHPGCKLIITNVENSTDSNKAKYNYLPIRSQFLNGANLSPTPGEPNQIPAHLAVHHELKGLIWKLARLFDSVTQREKITIAQHLVAMESEPRSTRKKLGKFDTALLKHKENSIFSFWGARIHVLSMVGTAKHSKGFQQKVRRLLGQKDIMITLYREILGSGTNMKQRVKLPYGKAQVVDIYSVPIYLICPDCNFVTTTPAVYYPIFSRNIAPRNRPVWEVHTEVLVCYCKNPSCSRTKQGTYNPIITPSDDVDRMEFHYIFNSFRDFFRPFEAQAHIFGGDYAEQQFRGRKPMRIKVQRVSKMFEALEAYTGKNKMIFVGKMITKKGKKISKTDPNASFRLSEFHKIGRVFVRIIKAIEEIANTQGDEELNLEYRKIIKAG